MTSAQRLASLLESGELEVEHILELVECAPAEVASLRTLERTMSPAEEGEVPYKDWLDAVCVFLAAGYPGLERLAAEPSRLPFVLGVLEQLRTEEALDLLAALAAGADAASALGIASTANALMALAGLVPKRDSEATLLQFLHSLLDRDPRDPAYGMALYALARHRHQTNSRAAPEQASPCWCLRRCQAPG